jgi:antagonist of KipI
MPALTVLRSGMLTTVQDLGRWGQQHLGVPVAGPMDWYSHRLANRLVGNVDEAAALEITLLGPELVADADVLCAVAGAAFAVHVGDARVRMHEQFTLPRGERLAFRSREKGARAVLAVRGGLSVPPVLGSRSTSLISRVGPFGGRALASGDLLPVGRPSMSSRPAGFPLPLPHAGVRLHVMAGPHHSRFTAAALRTLHTTSYTVTPESNRMGYRLDGAALAKTAAGSVDMLSDATPIGSLQVPPSGLPILLMADRQTTGGYPKIATVISADLPLAGQLAPGDWIEFVPVTRTAAMEALRRRWAMLAGESV